MVIASFYAPRRDHPRWFDYVPLLAELQRSCDRLGLRHIVLTDDSSLPFETFCRPLPHPLMKAVTEAQAGFVESGDWRGEDCLLVGADCLILRDPSREFGRLDLAVTYRGPQARYPVNTGVIAISRKARDRAAPFFRGIAEACGETWCDDQRAIQNALAPLPPTPCTRTRANMVVGFLPMRRFNMRPTSVDDRMQGSVILHFRGKAEHKAMMVPWAKRWLR